MKHFKGIKFPDELKIENNKKVEINCFSLNERNKCSTRQFKLDIANLEKLNEAINKWKKKDADKKVKK